MKHFRFLIFFLFLSYYLSAQDHHDRLATLDIQHYKFHLQLFEDKDLIKGKAEISLKFKKSVDYFELDLVHKGVGGKGMFVSEIIINGQAVEYMHTDEALKIRLKEKALVGKLYKIVVNYEGIPQDGMVIGRNKFGDKTFFGDNWPNRAHHWLPTVDHPSDKATVEFLVEAPNKFQVVGTGKLIEESDLDKQRRLSHWKCEVPLPTKVMVVGAAAFSVELAGVVDGIPVTTWVFPQNKEEGFHDYEQAVQVLDWFHRQIAPYPYTKLANVQSKTRYGGMENASNIFYFENSVNGKQEREGLIAHEIAHQWFGNSASEADWHHVWLSEGFATYFTNLYFEHKYGRDVFVEKLISQRSNVIRYAKQNPKQPIVDTSIKDYNRVLSTNTYQKAGWVLHMLRQELGTKNFWDGIRAYYQKYQFSNALTADFKNVMEEVSGQQLEAFFQQWIFQPGLPELEVSWRQNSTKGSVDLKIKRKGDFTFPLDIALKNTEGQVIAQKNIQISKESTVVSIPVIGQVSQLLLDPETKLLFIAKLTKE